MLYIEIIAVCCQIHLKHINKLCGQNVKLFNVKLPVHIVTAGLKEVLPVSTVLLLSVDAAQESFCR